MTAPQWKRGDVAMVTARWIRTDDHSERYAVRRPDGWWSRAGVPVRDYEVSDVRPLVVIDPEDREQVAALADAFVNARQGHPHGNAYPGEIDQLTNALRSLVADPKPEEPQGLGAVVEDEQGNHWIRHGAGARPWMLAGASPSNRDTYAYATLPATRVLSEGWRA